ncbi:MAG: hypothetical protein WBY84_10495, partial [Pseudolabrys sp.]
VIHLEDLNLLEILGRSTELYGRLPKSMAEGEELGSNLLRVAKSGLWVRAVPLEVHDPGQNGRRLKESQTAVPGDHPASTWHWDPCQTHIEPPD